MATCTPSVAELAQPARCTASVVRDQRASRSAPGSAPAAAARSAARASRDRGDQVGGRELRGGDVDARPVASGAGALPAGARPGRPRRAPSGPSSADQPGLLGQRHELGRRQHARAGVLASAPAPRRPRTVAGCRGRRWAGSRRLQLALRHSACRRSASSSARATHGSAHRRLELSGTQALPAALAAYMATSASRSSVAADAPPAVLDDADAHGDPRPSGRRGLDRRAERVQQPPGGTQPGARRSGRRPARRTRPRRAGRPVVRRRRWRPAAGPAGSAAGRRPRARASR